jgi:hypothetical protein
MRRTLVFAATLLLTTSSFASDTTSDLRKILNGEGYFGSGAGESWPYAGGFLVMKQNGDIPTFTDLPDEKMKPSAQDVTVDFPAVDRTKRFSISIVLKGLEAIIGGNPGFGFGHTSTMNFTELKAQGSRITYDQADRLVNSQTIPQIQEWMKTGHRVFVVGIILSTKNISLSTDSKFNIDATFNGSTASTCSTDDKNKNDNSNGKPNDKPNSSSPQSTIGSNRTTPLAIVRSSFVMAGSSAQNQGNSSQGGTTTSKPGGDLHVCKETQNKLTMKTDTPLVFAIGAYEVIQKTPNALMYLEPVISVPKNSGPFNEIQVLPGSGSKPSGPEMTKPNVDLAATVNPHWARQPWPTSGKQ